jgi:hypothetical protein
MAEEHAKYKLTKGETKDPVLALNNALSEMYQQLSPVDRKAIEEARLKEINRQKQATAKQSMPGSYIISPPERFLSELLKVIKK